VKVLVGVLLSMLLGCTGAVQSKKDPCGATVSVAPHPALVGVCRE